MKNKAKLTAQQGDLKLRRLDVMPGDEITKTTKRRCVLAEGEHHGHAHLVEDDEAELIQIGKQILLKLGMAATVTHEEHGPITLEPGIWEVGRVREYDYLSKMSRPVVD